MYPNCSECSVEAAAKFSPGSCWGGAVDRDKAGRKGRGKGEEGGSGEGREERAKRREDRNQLLRL